ncbi:hypothetical protein [Rhizorhabdus dicambivorans]|uniref:Extradiol ring-cleavage dioxygenase n=1 Tax=Rhizorhabdus dicambivorans TaxID=1850238 RepID=A0A2A4FVU6_9SPHN|nr:hypothetical protein [Rhizorhabdus dicambivorans]ATE64159.1 extradiol ring-cleavage dioxygenase [Rhizorhabdus dicambivorans]PCE42569.1 extradiol ring-cleavage dioxygenase [Rhizorhabdus dicambivorans]
MANIVLGIGAAHSPLLTIDWEEWQRRAEADYENPELNMSDGRCLSYAQLASENGEPYAALATSEQFEQSAFRSQANLDRLADALEAADPDVVLVIGDDQGELFSLANMPAMSIYYGDEILTNDVWGRPDKPAWMSAMAKGYAMDRVHHFPAAPALAGKVIAGLIERHVDVSAAALVDDPVEAGFGHAFGFIAERLMRGRAVPILPVLLNTYFPPNVMRPCRAYHVGQMLREAIEQADDDLRVAVVASGGLSHFVVDEALDRLVLAGLRPGQEELLCTIPPEALRSGSSEILNWIMTAGAVGHLPLSWADYEPVRRTPAGTGVGLAFACWGAVSKER